MLLFLAGLGLVLAVLGLTAEDEEAGHGAAAVEATAAPELWEKLVSWM